VAIDSTSKRRAVIQLPPFTLLPLADGTIDGFDRMQATWLYPMGAGAPGPGPEPEPEPEAGAVRRKGAAVRIITDRWHLEDDELWILLQ
jgi:hypothetical protein